MTKIETNDGKMTITHGSWLLPGIGCFFLVLAVLSIAILVIGPPPNARSRHDLVPNIAGSLIFSVVLLWRPAWRTTVLERSGAASLETRTLFSRKHYRTEKVRNVACVVGTYSAWISLWSDDLPPVVIIKRLKSWTWERKSPELRAQATRIAEFVGAPSSDV